MLDSLLKSKFYTKCKTNVKLIKTRLEAIKKKKSAVQKFLKNDIADLLRNGLDMNAYGRAEGLLIEQNMACCYEFVENYCANISSSSNLSLMQKQKECPDELKEAVASLMYAAARFADLPELRDLRNTFTERYGNSLEVYTNKEFIDMLSPKTYTKETKLQLLQDIANEFSIEWDSKSLEQKLFTPPTIKEQPKTVPLNDYDAVAGPRRGKGRFYGAKPNPSSSEDESSSAVTDFTQDDRKTSSSSASSAVSEYDAVDSRRPFPGRIRPPPYLKAKPEKARWEDEQEEDSKPRPISVRRRNDGAAKLRQPQGRENEDDEEAKLDDLLLQYSNRRAGREAGPAPGGSNARYIRGRRPEFGGPPGRAASMPPEPVAAAEARGPVRAASFQPDGHIHPKLPGDYDELAARIAALRGK